MSDQSGPVELLKRTITKEDHSTWRGTLRTHFNDVLRGRKPTHTPFEESLLRQLDGKRLTIQEELDSVFWEWDEDEDDRPPQHVIDLLKAYETLHDKYFDHVLSVFARKIRLFSRNLDNLKCLALSTMKLEIHPPSTCKVEHEGKVYPLQIRGYVALTGRALLMFADGNREMRKVYCRFQKTPCWQYVGVKVHPEAGWFMSDI